MKTLNFDTGIVTYSLNDKCEISINPTDDKLVSRLISLVDKLGAKREEYAASMHKAEVKDAYDVSCRYDAEMRAEIDAALGGAVCAAVFGEMSVLAMADGLPVFCNLIFAILDEVSAGWAMESQKTSERMEKYIAKYKK